MARKDWINVGISALVINAIDRFLETEDAKKMDIENKTQFINRLLVDFFARYKEATGIDHMKIDAHPGILDLTDTRPKKTKK
jgi:hypothetical protein